VAHLRPGDEHSRDASGRDRAQLLLLAGFVLAAIFVAFAFLLNSVIYAENLATRGEGTRTTHAVATANDVAAGTENVIGYANEHNTTDNSTLIGELRSGIADIERLTGTQQLTDGGVLRVEYVSHRSGTWIDQSYQERDFNSSTDLRNWLLFSDSDGARAFRIQVTDPDQLQNVNTSEPVRNFTVVASDGAGETWEMAVYHDNYGADGPSGTNYVVDVTDGNDNTRTCSIADDGNPFWINVSAGTFGGTECAALRFGEDISTIRQVEYENADNVYGTYRLMAAKGQGSVDIVYNSTGDAPPVTRTAIYDATVRVTYDSGDLYFETERKAEPGGDDA